MNSVRDHFWKDKLFKVLSQPLDIFLQVIDWRDTEQNNSKKTGYIVDVIENTEVENRIIKSNTKLRINTLKHLKCTKLKQCHPRFIKLLACGNCANELTKVEIITCKQGALASTKPKYRCNRCLRLLGKKN